MVCCWNFRHRKSRSLEGLLFRLAPKLRCRRKLGRALGWGVGRVCETGVVLTAARETTVVVIFGHLTWWMEVSQGCRVLADCSAPPGFTGNRWHFKTLLFLVIENFAAGALSAQSFEMFFCGGHRVDTQTRPECESEVFPCNHYTFKTD